MKAKPTKKQLRATADKLFSASIRARGKCEAKGFSGGWLKGARVKNPLTVRCGGALQCAHLVPRRYLSVRWDQDNAACLCAAHHSYFTYFPLEHEQFCKLHLGAEHYEALKLRARVARGAPDYEAILERLRGEVIR